MFLQGAIPANVLPFDVDGKIDEPAYREHIDSLVCTPGVGAVTCNGHAGEVASLDRAERERATAIAVEAAGGRVPVVCGIYSQDERDAAEKAREAEAQGADALLVMPAESLAYADTLDPAVDQFSRVADAVSLPLVAFVYPDRTGVHYPPDLLRRLCEIDPVVAVKDWSLDIAAHEHNLRVVRAAPHPVSMLTSYSTHLLPALAVGADGILSGHGSVVAGLQARLFAEVSSGDLEGARETYARIQVLTAVVYREPMTNMYARMKEQLVMLGHRLSATVRPPLRPVSEAERDRLRRALVEAGLLADGQA